MANKYQTHRGHETGHRYITEGPDRVIRYVHGQFCNAGHGWNKFIMENSTCGRLTAMLRGERLLFAA